MIEPVAISDVMLAFPADVEGVMPPWEEIPEEFRRGSNEWTKLADYWFACGLAGTTQFYLKEGIDGETAVRHLRAILGSFQPRHEHKMAAVAWLCSLWFVEVTQYEQD
jgi:hypothetical protein